MLHYDELKEAVDRGYITGPMVDIVRKNGQVFDYVLPGEPVKDSEVVTKEVLEEVLKELRL